METIDKSHLSFGETTALFAGVLIDAGEADDGQLLVLPPLLPHRRYHVHATLSVVSWNDGFGTTQEGKFSGITCQIVEENDTNFRFEAAYWGPDEVGVSRRWSAKVSYMVFLV